MRYLFFDIECANCFDGIGKLCEFGYVITDERLRVKECSNIIVNPECAFDKKGFAMSKIKLAYPYSEYYRRPGFEENYDKIRALFDSCDIAVGHNTRADAQYILDACIRYELPTFNYRFVDTQKAFRLLFEREKNLRLIELHNEFCAKSERVQKHNGVEDAMLTRDLAEYIRKKAKLTPDKLFTKCRDACGEVFEGKIVEYDTPLFGYSTSNKLVNKKNKHILDSFLRSMPHSKKRYTLPVEFERDNFRQMLVILYHLKRKGFGYTVYPNRGTYVTLGDPDEFRRTLVRRGEIMGFSEFLTLIGLTENDLINPDIDPIVATLDEFKGWYDRYEAAQRK